MPERLWNSPELLRQFELPYNDYDADDQGFTRLIGPEHAAALTSGAADLLTKYHGNAYTFSEVALQRVRPHVRLLEATVIYNPRQGTHNFMQLRDKPSVRDSIQELDRAALADEYTEPDDAFGDYSNVDVVMMGGGEVGSYRRITNVFSRDTHLPHEDMLELLAERHLEPFRTEKGVSPLAEAGEVTVYDFMILGHLIETDLNA